MLTGCVTRRSDFLIAHNRKIAVPTDMYKMAFQAKIKFSPRLMRHNQFPASYPSLRSLQICRVTNTSEEIYKNLGLKVPTGNEELEEVRAKLRW